MNQVWRRENDAESCPSCRALDGQVHDAETWAMHNLYPKSPRLLCAANCQCSLLETRDPERGDLGDVPLRSQRPPMGKAQQEDPPMPDPAEHRTQLTLQAAPTGPGEFQIVAITAGTGNGWNFTADALRTSLPLWDGTEVFVDHGAISAGRSVRDLGGLTHSPAWDDARQGIQLQLRTAGPSGPLVAAIGRELLADGAAHKPNVGFSADVLFTADKKTVTKILRVLSLDLVFDPARGGAFLRALNSVAHPRREEPMPDESPTAAPGAAAQLESDVAAVRALLNVQQEQARIAAEVEAARQVRLQMCAYLLDSGLAASRLPAAAQEPLRAQFKNRLFEPAELTAAIEAQRAMIAALTAGAVVQGPGRVHSMFSSHDQLQAAVDDMLGAPREDQAKSIKVARLSGVRELYLMLTGDHDFHGGYYAERAQFQHTTTTFSGLVTNSLNKAIVDHWAQLGRAGYNWWERIAHVEHFDTLNTITWTIFGSIGTLPSVAEGAEYTELAIGDSPETSTLTKYGGYVGVTLEAMDRDDTRKLRALPRELANAAIRRISGLVAAVFTDNAGVGPTLTDTGALFNATAVTTAGGHANLLTTALSSTQWDVVATAVYDQPMLVRNAASYYGTGAKMAVNPRFLLVPRALQLTAMQILYPTLERTSQIYSENQQRGEPGDVITVPEWTDANNWAAVVDPAIVPGICIGERFGLMPEIFVAGDELSPAVFMNDESRIKVRHFVAVGVADFRPLHKSNVA